MNTGPAKRTKWGTLAAMSLGYGVVQLDVTIVNTALSRSGRPFLVCYFQFNTYVRIIRENEQTFIT
jgi:hypothetical protein